MYKPRKKFLFWVVYVPIGVNIFVYAMELVSGTIGWFYAEPDSKFSSARHILDRGSTLDDFLRIRLDALILAVIIGLGLWLYEYYSIKKSIESEANEL